MTTTAVNVVEFIEDCVRAGNLSHRVIAQMLIDRNGLEDDFVLECVSQKVRTMMVYSRSSHGSSSVFNSDQKKPTESRRWKSYRDFQLERVVHVPTEDGMEPKKIGDLTHTDCRQLHDYHMSTAATHQARAVFWGKLQEACESKRCKVSRLPKATLDEHFNESV